MRRHWDAMMAWGESDEGKREPRMAWGREINEQ